MAHVVHKIFVEVPIIPRNFAVNFDSVAFGVVKINTSGHAVIGEKLDLDDVVLKVMVHFDELLLAVDHQTDMKQANLGNCSPGWLTGARSCDCEVSVDEIANGAEG